jgi:acyl-CoA synthetase (AMP-forming)/AMP-acid ligase II
MTPVSRVNSANGRAKKRLTIRNAVMLISDTLEWAAREHPTKEAWSFGDKRTSFAEADNRANQVANSLIELGFRPEERIAVLAENSDQNAELQFALSKAGIVAVPLNIRASPEEIHFIAQEADISGFIASAKLREKFEQAKIPPANLKTVIGLGSDHGLDTDYEDLVRAGSSEAPARRADSDSLRVIKFTSGTTGAPKGCRGTHRECLFNIMTYQIAMPYSEDDVCGLAISLGAGLGSYLLTIFAYRGCRAVILDSAQPGPILDAIERERITRITLVPTMIGNVIEEQIKRPRDLSSLALIGYTGSAATMDLIRRGHEVLGCGFYQSYGATESGGRIAHLGPEEHRQLLEGTGGESDIWGREVMPCGTDLPGFEIRLEDDEGNAVPEGEVGELVVRGESIFKGYWNRPDLNAEVLRDGWWRSGDLARRGENRMLYLVDRKKDMIISGGINIFSFDIERVIGSHPKVQTVAVVGKADPDWGEAVCAIIVAKNGNPDIKELDALCRSQLPTYKAPKHYYFVDEVPMTTTGKIRKSELRKMLAQGKLT